SGRYGYLIEDTSITSAVPLAASRASTQLTEATAGGLGRLFLSTGGLPLLNPAGLVATAPIVLFSGLSRHPEQAGLRLHYAVPTLAMMWLGSLLVLAKLRRLSPRAPLLASVALLAGTAILLPTSPFAPGNE